MGTAYNKTEELESDNPKDYKWVKIRGDDGDPAYTVILDNENVTFITDEGNMPTENQFYNLNFLVFKGTEQITTYKIQANKIVTPDGLFVDYNEEKKQLTVRCKLGTKIVNSHGTMEIPLLLFDTIPITKVFSYTVSRSSEVLKYTWFKYSKYNNPASWEMFDETSPEMQYIGVAYNKDTFTPSDDPEDYTWLSMHNKGDHGTKVDVLYYKTTYNTVENIPLPQDEYELLNVQSGVVSVLQGDIAFGYVGWSTTKPEYQEGYYLWCAICVTMNDGSYLLFSTPMLLNEWQQRKIGGTQLIRNSKTLIDERIYWF